jgi:hypothetical protein
MKGRCSNYVVSVSQRILMTTSVQLLYSALVRFDNCYLISVFSYEA